MSIFSAIIELAYRFGPGLNAASNTPELLPVVKYNVLVSSSTANMLQTAPPPIKSLSPQSFQYGFIFPLSASLKSHSGSPPDGGIENQRQTSFCVFTSYATTKPLPPPS